ncbi:MAG: Crp/Fnr family transcriptional regulator [Propionivibrio sp.]
MYNAYIASENPPRRFPQTMADLSADLSNVLDASDANGLLSRFPRAALHRLAPYLKLLQMPQNKVLHECGVRVEYVYFPVDSIIALLYVMENGDSVQTAMVGREGMVGISNFMGSTSPGCAVMQSAGSVLRLRAAVLAEEIERSPDIMRLLLRHTQALFVQLAQSLVCRRHHSVEDQFCMWLLTALDCSRDGELFVTHQLIAGMIGVRREGITEAAVNLQRQGIIRYRRGHITFIDRAALEKRVCECYGVVKRQSELLLSEPGVLCRDGANDAQRIY